MVKTFTLSAISVTHFHQNTNKSHVTSFSLNSCLGPKCLSLSEQKKEEVNKLKTKLQAVQDLMNINVLCSTHPNGHTQSPGSYSEIVFEK